MEKNELRLLPKGIYIWSIGLQEMISFENEQVIKITDKLDEENFFGTIQIVFGDYIGSCSIGMSDKSHGEVSASISQTLPYKLPEIDYPKIYYKSN